MFAQRRLLLCGWFAVLLATASCSDKTGETVTLDSQSPYAMAVVRQVGARIVYPKSSREAGIQGDVRISFVIGRTGELLDVQVVNSSANRALDEAALNAVRQGAPFPPIPMELKVDRVKILMPVHFKLR